MKKKLIGSFVLASAVLAQNAYADFGAELRTVTADGNTTPAVRFYNQGAPSGPGVDPSESGSIDNPTQNDPLWLVFDIDGDGIFNTGALDGLIYDGTVSGLAAAMIDPDDFIAMSSVNSAIQGRTIQNFVGLPSEAQTGGTGDSQRGGTLKDSYTILFQEEDFSNGGSFGFLQNFVNADIPSGGGNASLQIGSDIYADSFNFAVVPEPSAALLAGIGLGVLALYRRRASRR